MQITEPAQRALDVPLGSATRPTCRGLLHLIALVVVVPLLVALSIVADGARARAGVIVYAVGLCSMLTVSTVYHRLVHTVRARAAWRRADHATIYAAIAGTFTALALATLGTGLAIAMLVAIWSAAAAGVVVKVGRFDRSDRLGIVMYVAIGWAGLALVPWLWSDGGVVPIGLLFGGGVVYTIGAAGFVRRWPQLQPATFSYHEVWHACTVAAAGLHLAAVWTVVT